MTPRLVRASRLRTLGLAAIMACGVATRATAAVDHRFFRQQRDSALAADSFNRANQTPLAGNWTSTSLNLSSNHVVPASLGTDGRAYYSGTTWPANQYSKAQLFVTGTAGGDQGMGLIVRQSTSAVTYYRLAVDHATSNNVGLSKRVAGTYTSLATFTQSWTDGDVWELRVIGARLQVFRNGTQVGTDVTDCAIASGAAGIAYSSSETAASLDNWEGGAVVNPAPAWPDEPPGFVTFKNTDFTAFPTDGWSSDGGTIVTDATAPVSPTHHVIQWEYDTTLANGTSPGTVQTYEFDQVDAYFLGFYFKFSNPYSNGVNGTGMWWASGMAGGTLSVVLGQDSTIFFSVLVPDSLGGAYNLTANVSNPKVTLGTWHRFEHYFQPASSPTAHDGIIRWWIDGVLCGNYTDRRWPAPHQDWYAWSYWPGWDGAAHGHPAFTGYQWVDHTYLSHPITGLRAWDHFNRANETPIDGNWTSASALAGINLDSTRVVPAHLVYTDAEAYYTAIDWPNDQYSRAKLYVTGAAGEDAGMGLVVRATSSYSSSVPRTEYRLTLDHADSANVSLEAIVADAFTTLATFTQTWTDGDVWELRVTGATLQVFRNDSQVGSDVIDSSVTVGYPGIAYSSTDSAAAADDWEGGGIVRDDFARADETPLAGAWSSSGLNLSGDQVIPASLGTNGQARYAAAPWPSDQYSQARLCVVGTGGSDQGMGLLVRNADATTTYYRLAVDHASSNNVGLSKRINGAYTNLASFTQSWTNGDLWGLRVKDTTLQIFRNGTQVGSDVTDASIASGSAGLAYSSTETAATAAEWEGGAVSGGAAVPTPVDRTVATTLAANVGFIYEGPNPLQTGVMEGSIDPVRIAVLRGRVFDRSGEAVSGVTITVLNHPEWGQTVSRADGGYDFAANGGAPLTLTYAKAGYLPGQRTVATVWQDYAPVPSVSLVLLDTAVTAIHFSAPIEVARGTAQTDTNGTRRATLLFRQGTTATLVLPDTTLSVDTIHVRATEYTVGPTPRRPCPRRYHLRLPIPTRSTCRWMKPRRRERPVSNSRIPSPSTLKTISPSRSERPFRSAATIRCAVSGCRKRMARWSGFCPRVVTPPRSTSMGIASLPTRRHLRRLGLRQPNG